MLLGLLWADRRARVRGVRQGLIASGALLALAAGCGLSDNDLAATRRHKPMFSPNMPAGSGAAGGGGGASSGGSASDGGRGGNAGGGGAAGATPGGNGA